MDTYQLPFKFSKHFFLKRQLAVFFRQIFSAKDFFGQRFFRPNFSSAKKCFFLRKNVFLRKNDFFDQKRGHKFSWKKVGNPELR